MVVRATKKSLAMYGPGPGIRGGPTTSSYVPEDPRGPDEAVRDHLTPPPLVFSPAALFLQARRKGVGPAVSDR